MKQRACLSGAALCLSLAFHAGCGATVTPADAGIPQDSGALAPDLAHEPFDLAERDMARFVGDLARSDANPGTDAAADAGDVDSGAADLACAEVCNTPPATVCDRNHVVSSDVNGLCTGGACVYPMMIQVCPNGCYQAACTQNGLSFCGNTNAYQTNGPRINIGPNVGGTTPANNSVSVTVETFPHGTVSVITLIWATDARYTKKNEIEMTWDKEAGNNDQFYAVIPMQPAGTQVYFNIVASGWGPALPQYAPGNFGDNYTYTSQ